MGQLTVARIKTLREPGRYVDGDGLMLLVKASGAQSWMLRVRIKGDRRDIGLGSTKVMTLAEARAKAIELRRQIAQGIDPIAEKKKVEDPVPTFADAARRVHAEQQATWKNGKHQVQWIKTLETHAFPFFGDNLVNTIEGPHNLGQQPTRPRSRQHRIDLVGAAQRYTPMLAAMAQPNEPIGATGGPHPHSKASKFAVPDAIFAGQQPVLAACEIAVEQGPSSGLLPVGDHMAIIVSRTAARSRQNQRFIGDRTAIASTRAAKCKQHLLH